MSAYAYPIKIHRSRVLIHFEEVRVFDSNSLTLDDLEFVGEDSFSVHPMEFVGYEVQVSRTRRETTAERDHRVSREIAYMAEYNSRRSNK